MLVFLHLAGSYYMTLMCSLYLVSRAKLCLVRVFQDTVTDSLKMRNLPKILLSSFKNVGPRVC